MNRKGLEKEGHIDEVQEILVELTYLHNSLLTIMNDAKYKSLCENAHEALEEFKQKSNMAQRQDVEILMHAMFMKLQLKMRQKEISAETESAFDLMRIQLAYLAREYQRMKSGDWDYLNN
jgi:TRAP-type C4-dicarboxylate transport system substrate-binding protein